MPRSKFVPPLVQDMVDMLLSKFESLSREDRQMMAIATIEAAAWIAAMESTSYSKRRGLGIEGATKRLNDYQALFECEGQRDLDQNFTS